MSRGGMRIFRASNAIFVICWTMILGVIIVWVADVAIAEQCLHDECVQQAAYLMRRIDASNDPCEDFVEFACGTAFSRYDENISRSHSGSRSRREIGPSRSPNQHIVRLTGHTEYLWLIRQKISKELSNPYHIEEHRTIGLAKMYWQSCKLTSAKEALAGVRILFKRLGGWPLITEGWQEKHFTWDKFGKCARLLGFLPRMFVHVGLNDEHVEKAWYANDTIELTLERSKFMHTRGDMLGAMERAGEYFKIAHYISEKKKPDMREIEEALQFGKRVFQLTHSQGMPIVELKTMPIGKLQKAYPFVDWMDYIRSMLTRRQANYLSDRNCVIVDVCYLSQIGNLLASTSKRVHANYAFLAIVDDLSLLIRPQLSLALAYGTREIERICFDSVTIVFRQAIEMILAKMAGQKMRQKVNEITTVVAQQALQLFNKIPWMDHQTQLQAIKKSERTTFVNLFLDDIFDDRYFDRLEFTQPNASLVLFREVNVFLVDRYYLQLGRPRNPYILNRRDNRTMFAIFKTPFSSAETSVRPDRISNQIYVPAGAALQGRVSVQRELDFLNYATIGLQIANAMGHQIYQRGAFIDCNGHWREGSWWTKTTQRQFASRHGCNDVGTVRPVDEMSPTFGFIGAAEIAYKSMFEHSGNEREVTLPGVKYNTKQLFWIAAVASDCDRDLKHRYNAMVSNINDFAEDFKCPPGSKMNATEKCKMWLT